MADKYNFQVDSLVGRVIVDVSLDIFPASTILLASRYFIEKGGVVIEKGGENKAKVTIIPNQKLSEGELEKIANDFNNRLISTFSEERERWAHDGIRDTMMKAALLQRNPKPQNICRKHS